MTVFVSIIAVACGLFVFEYGRIFERFIKHWKQQPTFEADTVAPKTSVAVLIPARNEGLQISKLLESLATQYFPSDLWEFVIIDDHSTDNTAAIVSDFMAANPQLPGRLILLKDWEQSGKKAALRAGIAQTSSSLIVTTDADCSMNERWLHSLVRYYETNSLSMILGPVQMLKRTGWLATFQSMELMGLMGVTAASATNDKPLMANGANLLYERTAYESLRGTPAKPMIASGDDVFLMLEMHAQRPNSVGFIKSREAIVYTEPSSDLQAFLQQRIRWASKSAHFEERHVRYLGSIVAGLYAVLLICLLCTPFKPVFLALYLISLFFKGIIDFFFLRDVTKFFKSSKLHLLTIPVQFVYPFYALLTVILSRFGAYQWKGRRVR